MIEQKFHYKYDFIIENKIVPQQTQGNKETNSENVILLSSHLLKCTANV